LDVCINNLQLEECIEELGKQTEPGFFDPVATYMEKKFSLNNKPDFLLHNHTHFVHVWLSAFTFMFCFKHFQASSLLQLLNWLTWHYNIT